MELRIAPQHFLFQCCHLNQVKERKTSSKTGWVLQVSLVTYLAVGLFKDIFGRNKWAEVSYGLGAAGIQSRCLFVAIYPVSTVSGPNVTVQCAKRQRLFPHVSLSAFRLIFLMNMLIFFKQNIFSQIQTFLFLFYLHLQYIPCKFPYSRCSYATVTTILIHLCLHL